MPRNENFLPHLWVYMASVPELFQRLSHRFRQLGYEIQLEVGNADGRNYCYAIPPGEQKLPLMMVGHLDTVHQNLPTNKDIEIKNGVATAPKCGIGADDRAGIAGILEVLNRGHRPYILLTDLEERGGHGAKAAAAKLKTPDGVHAVIELDRRGATDAVMYNCDNPDFTKWVEGFGFKEAFGSYTDIREVCPKWGIAGVNLSIGYYEAHQKSEKLKIAEWWATIDKVCQMMDAPPTEKFAYIERKYTTYSNGSRWLGWNGNDSDWSEEGWYYGQGNFPTTAKTKHGFDEISVAVLVSDLATVLGGDPKDYAAIVGAYKDEIEGAVEDFIYQMVLDLKENQFRSKASEADLKAAEQAAISG